MATHNWPLLLCVSSSISLYNTQATPLLFLSNLSNIYSHIGWLPLQAGHAAGRPLDDIHHPTSWHGAKQLSMAHLFCEPEGKSVGGMA